MDVIHNLSKINLRFVKIQKIILLRGLEPVR